MSVFEKFPQRSPMAVKQEINKSKLTTQGFPEALKRNSNERISVVTIN